MAYTKEGAIFLGDQMADASGGSTSREMGVRKGDTGMSVESDTSHPTGIKFGVQALKTTEVWAFDGSSTCLWFVSEAAQNEVRVNTFSREHPFRKKNTGRIREKKVPFRCFSLRDQACSHLTPHSPTLLAGQGLGTEGGIAAGGSCKENRDDCAQDFCDGLK